jgi:hypothetical protein
MLQQCFPDCCIECVGIILAALSVAVHAIAIPKNTMQLNTRKKHPFTRELVLC